MGAIGEGNAAVASLARAPIRTVASAAKKVVSRLASVATGWGRAEARSSREGARVLQKVTRYVSVGYVVPADEGVSF